MLDTAPNNHVAAPLPEGPLANEPGQRAQAALASSPVVDLRELTVCHEGHRLLISGSVHCFYHKQLAQETVRPHCADLRMVNDVAVIP